MLPIGFHWDGERIFVCTATTAPKVAALAERPNVALTIDSEPGAMQSLQIRGVAELEIVDGVPPEYLAASRKPWTTSRRRLSKRASDPFYEQMARISIAPRWARLYDFERGRVPGFLRRLTEG